MVSRSTTIRTGAGRWWRPLAAAGILIGVGVWVIQSVESAERRQIEEDLRTTLEAQVKSLRLLLQTHARQVEVIAGAPRTRGTFLSLLASHQQGVPATELGRSESAREVRELLSGFGGMLGYMEFLVTDRVGTVVVAQNKEALSAPPLSGRSDFLQRALAGEVSCSRPFLWPRAGEAGGEEVPALFVAAPIRNEAGEVAGALAFRMDPEEDFSQILQVARAGDSGESYAFDSSGLMLSRSRFEEELYSCGLLAAGESSMLRVEVRNPGGNLLEGYRPTASRKAQPLTRMAASAVEGQDGTDASGYRDYRGVMVVGAWRWLPGYGFGVATEQDRAEAYAPLRVLRRTYWGLLGLLLVAGVGVVITTRWAEILGRRFRRAQKDIQRLGQYSLEVKIGEGGMGAVYLGRHAMLRRPTAIKLLPPDRVSPEAIGRFEREVQNTSRLTHPNTIAIYDYGRTPEGVFYYAMEFLTGVPLDELVREVGALPEGRVIHILRQACASLAEAHSLGLVHRDIKPANMVLCERGGEHDVVKVLDFGLVKQIDSRESLALSTSSTIAGTPYYLSPEAITDPRGIDARADIYALGAVAFNLLTGLQVFEGKGVFEILQKHLEERPAPPSLCSSQPVSEELEAIILRCLAKSREDRPQSAAELSRLLAACPTAAEWDQDAARAWWTEKREWLESTFKLSVEARKAASQVSDEELALAVDLDHRTQG